MEIGDLARLRMPSEPTVSPDGATVVVAVTRLDLTDDAYRSELWAVPADGSAPPRRFTNGPRDSRPRFSPDGAWLAFTRTEEGGKPQLLVMPAHGGEPRRLADHHLGAGDHVWSPDSTRLTYIARVAEQGRYGTDPDVPPDKEPPRRITTRKYRLDNLGFTIDRRPHVFVVDALADDPEPLQVTRGDFDHAAPTWSPDGLSLAFVSARHDDRDADLVSDVFLCPADGGDASKVTDSTLPASRPEFVPDGETLVFCAHGNPDVVGRNVRLYAVPADGSSAPRPLSEREAFSFDNYGTGSAQPLVFDGDAVLSVTQRRGALELVRVPLDDGEPTVVASGPRQISTIARGGRTTVVVAADDTSAGEVVALDPDGSERVLTDFGSQLARSTSLRPMQEVTATAPDGYPVHGWVVKPAGTGPFPVLLNIHGGPFTQYGWTLFDEVQIYAGAGYAVVMGNPRGSSGYGESHGRAIVESFGTVDHDDLTSLLDTALEDADLDETRVGVMGGSYGGFMTTWMVGASDRFLAAVSERSVNAWDSFTGSSDIGWFFVDSYCGTDPEAVARQSPLTYADRIRTPTLIIHSEQDWRCPVEQAQRLYERLKRNGVEAEMLLFPGEGHELTRSGLPSHRVARFEAILDWFGRHLR